MPGGDSLLGFVIETMRLSDIAQVMEIEKRSFPTAWPASAYRREIQQNRLARYVVALDTDPVPSTLTGTIRAPASASVVRRLASGMQRMVQGTVAPSDLSQGRALGRQVAGYLGLWLMVDEAHITTIATGPPYRGKGLGEYLLVAGFEIAADMQANVVTLEVRVGNLPAIRLYEKYSMRQVGIRKNYYTDTHEDALIMTSEDIRSPEFQLRFRQLKARNRERLLSGANRSTNTG